MRADSCRLSPVTRRVAGSSPVVPTVRNRRRDVAQLVEHLVYLDTLSALLSFETNIFSGPMRLGYLTQFGCFRGASAERPANSLRVEACGTRHGGRTQFRTCPESTRFVVRAEALGLSVKGASPLVRIQGRRERSQRLFDQGTTCLHDEHKRFPAGRK